MKDGSLRNLPFVLVSGGCRSGKSAYAERLAQYFSRACLYIATAEISDEEMRERVKAHQRARGAGWRLHEVTGAQAPELWRAVASLVEPGEAVLLDCLSLWASACMRDGKAPADFPEMCRNLLSALWRLDCPVVVVSSEVGMGVVPASPEGRAFRDMAGLASQTAARLATGVILMVSGIPLAVKGELPVFEQAC